MSPPAPPRQWVLAKLGELARPPRPAGEVALEASLEHDLDIDSLAFIEALIGFESDFDVRLSEEYLLMSNHSSVADLVAYVERLAGEPAAESGRP